jgi:impB/mucB/samB family
MEQTMNMSTANNAVRWLFLDLYAFFASREQQEAPALRGKPVIVVQTPTDSAVAIAASCAAKREPTKRRNQGETLVDIARSYHVTPSTISRRAPYWAEVW